MFGNWKQSVERISRKYESNLNDEMTKQEVRSKITKAHTVQCVTDSELYLMRNMKRGMLGCT